MTQQSNNSQAGTRIPCLSDDDVASLIWFDESLPVDEPSEDQVPVVLMIPAMGVPARFYQRLAAPFATMGKLFVTMELRGHGESRIRPSRNQNFGYRHIVEYDIPAALSAVNQRWPGRPVYLMGHSLGGQMCALFAAANPQAVLGYIGVACATVYWRSYGSGALPLLLATQTAATVAQLLGYFLGKRLGFAGLESRGLISDWARQSRTGDYKPAGSTLDYESMLLSYAGRALIISIDGDFFAPRSGVDHLAGKTPGATVTRVHLTDAELMNLKRTHFDWVKQPEPVLAHIERWLEPGAHL